MNEVSSFMTKNIIAVAADCPLQEAVEVMQQHKISFLVIAFEDKPIGVLSERDIVRLACEHVDPQTLLIKDVMTSPVITVEASTDLFTVYDLLNRKKIRHMVVVDSYGCIAGITTLTNILGGLSVEYFVELKQVDNIMSHNILTLQPHDTVQAALDLMAHKRISCVIVTHNNKPVGILTERDVTRLYGKVELDKEPVSSIMTSPVRTVAMETFIPQANAIMREEKIRHLVVVDEKGHLSGLISQTDIARRVEEHYMGYLQDLVKQQGDKLSYEHERFNILFEQNPNAVISMNTEGYIEEMNQACVRLSGYTAEELKGQPFTCVVQADDMTRMQISFDKVGNHNVCVEEFCMLQKSGNITHILNSFIPIYTDHGLYRVYAIMHDISDKKTAQRKLRNTQEKLQLLSQAVEQASESMMITNRQGEIEFVNQAFSHITGYEEHDVIHQNISMLVNEEQDESLHQEMWDTLLKGEKWQSRLMAKRKNGELFPAEVSVSPVVNANHEITHFIRIKRDLSEKEALEAKFYQAQKMEAIGTLVGGIAHDFNNMLSGMVANVYLATKKSQGNPEVLKQLERVDLLTQRSAGMIQQLLAFARKGIVNMEDICITSFFKEVAKFVEPIIPENISFEKDIDAKLLYIRGDATQLHQIVMNLVNNAKDAVEHEAKPCIRLKLDLFSPNKNFLDEHLGFKAGEYAHLRVTDNGCGISKAQQENLFEPFFTTKETGKGTGLGLSMVFGAVKTHGGYVDVESTEGIGSTFHVYIPVVTSILSGMLEHSLRDEEVLAGVGETILLADDEDEVRQTMIEVLEDLGYRVLSAANGEEAVVLFEKHQDEVALLLLDIVMPKLGGMAAAEEIWQIRGDVPVIFMTGYDKEHTIDDTKKCKVLAKPIRFDALSQELREMIQKN